MSAILEAGHLRAGYEAVQVVHDASFTVPRGSITALVGGNGAGKTTVIKTIVGSLPRFGGAVIFKGEEISDQPPHARVNRGLALVPEGRLIFPRLTVAENLRLGAIVPRAQAGYIARREEIYELFPRLHERRTQMGGTLSGGEQQMLALGRGLCPHQNCFCSMSRRSVSRRSLSTPSSRPSSSCAGAASPSWSSSRIPRALCDRGSRLCMENGRIALEGAGRDLPGHAKVREAILVFRLSRCRCASQVCPNTRNQFLKHNFSISGSPYSRARMTCTRFCSPAAFPIRAGIFALSKSEPKPTPSSPTRLSIWSRC
jgi:branched-chain amino acid transport system ATP-binding protein